MRNLFNRYKKITNTQVTMLGNQFLFQKQSDPLTRKSQNPIGICSVPTYRSDKNLGLPHIWHSLDSFLACYFSNIF